MSFVGGLSSEFKEWLTGFWEGDGSCGREFSSVIFYQKEPQVLRYIQETLGVKGAIRERGNVAGWVLTYGSRDGDALLWVLSSYVVSTKRLTRLNTLLSNLGLPLASGHKPTESWFAGFWDAEGSSWYKDRYLRIAVGQKDAKVLEDIKALWGFGKVYGTSWLVASKADVTKLANYLTSNSHNESKRLKLLSDVNEVRIARELHLKFKELSSEVSNAEAR